MISLGGPWVLGFEGEALVASVRATDFDPPGTFANAAGLNDAFNTEITSLFLGTARIGYAMNTWQLYVTGGLAVGEVEITATDGPNGTFESEETHTGWTIGAGADAMLTPNVIFGLQYNYVELDSERHSGFAELDPDPNIVDVDVEDMHVVRARVSIRFGREPAPEPLK